MLTRRLHAPASRSAAAALAAVLAAALCALRAAPAAAHPFGVGSVNRYLGVELAPGGGVRLAYLLDLGELPTATELERLDPDHDGQITPAEREAYLDAKLPPIVAQWTVELDGARVPTPPRVVSRSIEVQPGQGGLPTLRVLAELAVDPPPGATPRAVRTVHLRDPAFADRAGWREIRAEDSPTTEVVSSNVPAPSPAARAGTARSLRVDDATFTLRARGAAAPPATRAASAPPRGPSRGLLALGLGALALALLALAAVARARAARPRPAARSGADTPRAFAALDARVRVLATVALVASIALVPVPHARALGAHALLVLALIASARAPLGWTLGRLAAAAGWGALFGLLRALARGAHDTGPLGAVGLAARVALALAATVPLAATTSLTALAAALAGLRLPAAFVETTAATARGVVLLRDEAARLSRARQLRAPAAGPGARLGLYGTLAAALFERGLKRAERAQLAMALRGFDGVARGARRAAPPGAELALLAGWVALLAAAHRLAGGGGGP